MTRAEEVAARSVIVGAIGLAIGLTVLLMTLFLTHDWPVMAPALVITVVNAGIILYNVWSLRRMGS